MRTNAPPTIASDTPRLSRVEVFAADFTIRSIFSVKFSAAAAALAAEFSKPFLAASPDTAKIDNVALICVTTCKSRSRKRLSGQKRKLKLENWMSAINAEVPEPSRDLAVLIVPFAAAVVRELAPVD